jgi:hypothetical protein
MPELTNLHQELPFKEFLNQYPKGIFIYLNSVPDRNLEIKSLLQNTFPGYYIHMIPGANVIFPQDSGMQIGNKLYTTGLARIYASHFLIETQGFDYQERRQIMPDDSLPHIEGGLTVSIPTLNTIAYASEKDDDLFPAIVSHGIKAMPLKKIMDGLKQFCGNPEFPSKDGWLYFSSGIFTRERKHHIDLILTGLSTSWPHSIKWYLDEILLNYLKQHKLLDDQLKNAKPFPHELSVKGGLNILYTHNDSNFVVLVPSRDAIGPIWQDLVKSKYQIVELGEDQVSPLSRSGVKCNSLKIDWKKHKIS